VPRTRPSDSRKFTEEFPANFFEREFMIGPQGRVPRLARQILPALTLAEAQQDGKSFGGAGNRVIWSTAPRPARPRCRAASAAAIGDESAAATFGRRGRTGR